MTEKLREYIDTQFRGAPPTQQAVEMKEEILQNLTDKYNDMLKEGKSEEAAYNIAVASVGDLSQLIASLESAAPPTPEQQAEYDARQKKKALFTAVAVAMYIFALVPLFYFHGPARGIVSFALIAAATGLMIYLNMTMPAQRGHTMAEEFQAWRATSGERRQLYRTLVTVLWIFTAVIYFLLTFTTWKILVTWLVFPLAAAVQAILKAVFDIRR